MDLLSVRLVDAGAQYQMLFLYPLALSYYCLVLPKQFRLDDSIFPTAYCEKSNAKIWLDSNDELHRVNAPAFMTKNLQVWFSNGLRHRTNNKPAEIDREYLGYFANGQMYREDFTDKTGPSDPRAVITEHWKDSNCVSEIEGLLTLEQFYKTRDENFYLGDKQ